MAGIVFLGETGLKRKFLFIRGLPFWGQTSG
jgi:hypothetical protein